MIKGSCHCGAVTFEILERPKIVVSCNCSICRRLNASWVHSDRVKSTLNAPKGATRVYKHGDKEIEFHTCQTCGCTTHWMAVDKSRFALNAQLASEADMEGVRVRRFDGADTWEFLD